MNPTVIWLMLVLNGHSNIWSAEFNTEERCKAAAETIHKTLDEHRLLGSSRIGKPICIKIEK